MENFFKNIQEFFNKLLSGFSSGGGNFFNNLLSMFGIGNANAATPSNGATAQNAPKPGAQPAGTAPAQPGAKQEAQPSAAPAAQPAATTRSIAQPARTPEQPLPTTVEAAPYSKTDPNPNARIYKAEGSTVATVDITGQAPQPEPVQAAAATAPADAPLTRSIKAAPAPEGGKGGGTPPPPPSQGDAVVAEGNPDNRNWFQRMVDRGRANPDYTTQATFNPHNPNSPTNQVLGAIGGQIRGRTREMQAEGGIKAILGVGLGSIADGTARSVQYRQQVEWERDNLARRGGYTTRDDGTIMCRGDVNASVPNAKGQWGVAACNPERDSAYMAAREYGADRFERRMAERASADIQREIGSQIFKPSGHQGGQFGRALGKLFGD